METNGFSVKTKVRLWKQMAVHEIYNMLRGLGATQDFFVRLKVRSPQNDDSAFSFLFTRVNESTLNK